MSSSVKALNPALILTGSYNRRHFSGIEGVVPRSIIRSISLCSIRTDRPKWIDAILLRAIQALKVTGASPSASAASLIDTKRRSDFMLRYTPLIERDYYSYSYLHTGRRMWYLTM